MFRFNTKFCFCKIFHTKPTEWPANFNQIFSYLLYSTHLITHTFPLWKHLILFDPIYCFTHSHNDTWHKFAWKVVLKASAYELKNCLSINWHAFFRICGQTNDGDFVSEWNEMLTFHVKRFLSSFFLFNVMKW